MFLLTLLKSSALIFVTTVYCNKTLPRHDDPLATTISHETRKSVIAANYDGDTGSSPCDFTIFDD